MKDAMVYGLDFTVSGISSRHRCIDCGKPLRTKGACRCAGCNMKRVGSKRKQRRGV